MPITDLTRTTQLDGADAIVPEPGKNPLLYGFYFRKNIEEATSSRSISTAHSDKMFSNKGASALVTLTLPNASAGLTYSFIVQNANGIKISPATGHTIRFGSTVTSGSNSIQSTSIGSTITLMAISATEWYASSAPNGTWSVV